MNTSVNKKANKRVEALLRHGIAPLGGIMSYLLAPQVNCKHPAAELSTFFAGSASVFGTFFIALAVLSLLSPIANLRFSEIVGHITFIYLALGIIAAAVGSAPSWPNVLYDYLFAITGGAGIATVVAVTRLGIENMQIQRAAGHSVLAQQLAAALKE